LEESAGGGPAGVVEPNAPNVGFAGVAWAAGPPGFRPPPNRPPPPLAPADAVVPLNKPPEVAAGWDVVGVVVLGPNRFPAVAGVAAAPPDCVVLPKSPPPPAAAGLFAPNMPPPVEGVLLAEPKRLPPAGWPLVCGPKRPPPVLA
jgi:hypothetical protein